MLLSRVNCLELLEPTRLNQDLTCKPFLEVLDNSSSQLCLPYQALRQLSIRPCGFELLDCSTVATLRTRQLSHRAAHIEGNPDGQSLVLHDQPAPHRGRSMQPAAFAGPVAAAPVPGRPGKPAYSKEEFLAAYYAFCHATERLYQVSLATYTLVVLKYSVYRLYLLRQLQDGNHLLCRTLPA